MFLFTKVSRRLFIVCAPILLILVCWQPLKPYTDIWMHAAVGRWILEHGTIPHSALFLWTYAGTWKAHSWLAEIATYDLMHLCGEMGGAVLMVALSTLAVLLAFGIALWPIIKRKEMPSLAAVMFIAALTASSPRFAPRPELFTTVFTVLICATLIKLPAKPNRTDILKLRWIPFLFILWANLHGAVIFGLACLWIAAVCNFIQNREGWGLIGISALSTLALLINPYGIGYFEIYAPVANHSFSYIAEWRPFWVHRAAAINLPISELILFIGASTAYWLAGEKRLYQAAWLALSTAAFLYARRNMDLMALMCLIVFAKNYAGAMQSQFAVKLKSRFNAVSLAAASSALVGAYLVYLLVISTESVIQKPFVKSTLEALPTQQADFIAANFPPGTKILNLYNASAYLEWRLGDKYELDIDGLNAYPISVYQDWVQIWNATPRGIELLNKSDVTCIAGLRVPVGEDIPPLYSYLVNDKSWRLIYAGQDGPVFVKVQQDFLSGSELDSLTPKSN